MRARSAARVFAAALGGLHIEDLSARPVTESRGQLNVGFQIVNGGGAIDRAFRTAIVLGPDRRTASTVRYVTTRTLDAGERAYVNVTLAVPAGLIDPYLRVKVDADGVVGATGRSNVAPMRVPLLAPVPDRWVSLGPRRVTAPAVPTLGLGQYDAVGRLGPVAVDPSNPQIIYVGSSGELGHEGCGLWKTVNGGGSWTPIADNLPGLAVAAIAIDRSCVKTL